jgi:hypothetical protein
MLQVTIDFTDSAEAELKRVSELTGMTTAEIMRNAFLLLRCYVNALSQHKKVIIVDTDKKGNVPRFLRNYCELEVPVFIPDLPSGG